MSNQEIAPSFFEGLKVVPSHHIRHVGYNAIGFLMDLSHRLHDGSRHVENGHASGDPVLATHVTRALNDLRPHDRDAISHYMALHGVDLVALHLIHDHDHEEDPHATISEFVDASERFGRVLLAHLEATRDHRGDEANTLDDIIASLEPDEDVDHDQGRRALEFLERWALEAHESESDLQ